MTVYSFVQGKYPAAELSRRKPVKVFFVNLHMAVYHIYVLKKLTFGAYGLYCGAVFRFPMV